MDNTKKWKALIVDDQAENLRLLGYLLNDEFELGFAQNGFDALVKANEFKPDIILLDIMMPKMDGYEVCKKLKSDSKTSDIPVIFITGAADIANEKKAFEVGGSDFITKPINPSLVLLRVNNILELYNQKKACKLEIVKRTEELEEIQKSAIFMLGTAGHYNDDFTGVHIWRMASYSALLAQAVGWKAKECKNLQMAASMHDTGKIGISDTILRKPGKFNQEEHCIMQTHTKIGYNILSKSRTPLFEMAAQIALNHHERWDGTGYPNGLKGEKIPESARIVAIADVFDALTMKRPYKEEWEAERSFQEIEAMSGTFFDPVLVEKFLSIKDKILNAMEKYRKE